MIIDWYEHVPGQPITCIFQINSEDKKKAGDDLSLPSYIDIVRDITDLGEFKPLSMANKDYKYDPN